MRKLGKFLKTTKDNKEKSNNSKTEKGRSSRRSKRGRSLRRSANSSGSSTSEGGGANANNNNNSEGLESQPGSHGSQVKRAAPAAHDDAHPAALGSHRPDPSLTMSQRMRRGDCQFPAESIRNKRTHQKKKSKHKLKKDKTEKTAEKVEKTDRTEKSVTERTDTTEEAAAAHRGVNPASLPRSLKNFASLMKADFQEKSDGEKAKRQRRTKRSKRKRDKDHDQESAASEGQNDASSSDGAAQKSQEPEEYALSACDLEALNRTMPREMLGPDVNVYDPPDLTDSELEMRTDSIFSVQRFRYNTALTYRLINEEDLWSEKESKPGKPAEFQSVVERRTFHVVHRERAKDDTFQLLNIVLQSAKEGGSNSTEELSGSKETTSSDKKSGKEDSKGSKEDIKEGSKEDTKPNKEEKGSKEDSK